MPPTAPFTASPSLVVGAAVLDTASCPTLNGDGTLSFVTPPTDAGSDQDLGTNGTSFTVSFDKSKVGRRGYVVLRDSSTQAILGLTTVAVPLAPQPDASPYYVSPIQHVGGPGASTIAPVLYCELEKHGYDLSFGDVAALVNDEVAASGYNPSSDPFNGTATSVAAFIGQYGTLLATARTLGNLPADIGDLAQQNVDLCLNKQKPAGSDAHIACTGANTRAAHLEAERYRFWTIATQGTGGSEAMTVVAQLLGQRFATSTSAASIAYAFNRRTQMAAIEAATVRIRADANALGLGSDTVITGQLDSAASIILTSTDPVTTATDVSPHFNNVVTRVQNTIVVSAESTSCTIIAAFNTGHGGISGYNWSAATAPGVMFQQMFDPNPSAGGSVRNAVLTNLGTCTQSIGSPGSSTFDAVVDLDTYAAINATPVP